MTLEFIYSRNQSTWHSPAIGNWLSNVAPLCPFLNLFTELPLELFHGCLNPFFDLLIKIFNRTPGSGRIHIWRIRILIHFLIGIRPWSMRRFTLSSRSKIKPNPEGEPPTDPWGANGAGVPLEDEAKGMTDGLLAAFPFPFPFTFCPGVMGEVATW